MIVGFSECSATAPPGQPLGRGGVILPPPGREGLIVPPPDRLGRPAGVVASCHHLVTLNSRAEMSSPILGLAHCPGRSSHRGNCLFGSPGGENMARCLYLVGCNDRGRNCAIVAHLVGLSAVWGVMVLMVGAGCAPGAPLAARGEQCNRCTPGGWAGLCNRCTLDGQGRVRGRCRSSTWRRQTGAGTS